MTKDLILSHDDHSKNLATIENVMIKGDLSKLSDGERLNYYKMVCDSLNLNPLTKPFDYILLNGKLTLYATKNCTEQLRKLNGVSIEALDDKVVDDLYIVKAKARDKNGRTDESTGAVNIGNLRGEAKANAIMKAETKAKRRVTLSISGLGWCDETEVESIPGAQKVPVNLETGEIPFQVSETKEKTSQILDAESGELSQKLKISEQQLSEIYTLEAQVDNKCRENFKAYLLAQHNITEYQDIPKEAFASCTRGLLANIEMNKNNKKT